MRKLLVFLAGIVLLLLLCSGFFVDFIEFFTWLFTLQYIAPDTSIFGNIIVRILTFAVSYTLVGIIFNALGWFNRKIMSIAYFVVSTLLGFALAYVVMIIEEHLLEIGVVLSVIFAIAVAVIIFIIINIKNNK